ncbi:MAG: acyl-CoA desaturase [Planctomycetota bacterium]|nr:acyl-CoA desaturase [Planctomycetota bacterium]
MPPIFKRADDEKVNWITSIPFAIVHLMPLLAIFTGVSWFDVGLCFALYYIRMFFITAAYHRYFAHRSYKLGRITQFVMAFGGATAVQKGPLWWAGHHRHHHKFSDTEEDIHSPKRGFWWSHIGWILCDKYVPVPKNQIEDFHKYPELVWLDRHFYVAPLCLALSILLAWGPSALLIGFFLSTVLLYHGTFLVNSLAHVFGSRRYATRDTSRNSLVIALLTCGEGWHNNHHHFQSTAKAGFYWWEIDVTYYVLKLMSFVGLAWDLRGAPKSLRAQNQIKDGHFDVGMFEEYWGKGFATLDRVRDQVAAYCAARQQVLSGFLEDTRRGAEDYLSGKKTQAGELCEATRQSCRDYLAEKEESFDSFLLELQSQTSEYCENKSKALDRSITMLKVNAGDFYAIKKTAIDEIMVSMQQQLEDFIAVSRQSSQDWKIAMAELEQRFIVNPA